jgi:hypothetical protein
MSSTFSPTCIFSSKYPNHFGCPHLAALKTPLPTPGMDAPAGHFPPPFGNVLQAFQIAFRYRLFSKESIQSKKGILPALAKVGTWILILASGSLVQGLR